MKNFLAVFLCAGTIYASGIDVVFPRKNAALPYVERCHVIGSVKKQAGASLVCNGAEVKVFETGAFLFMLPVRPGKNAVTLKYGGKTLKHMFSVAEPPVRSNVDRIRPVSPVLNQGVGVGESVRLSCLAPTGRIVNAMVGERDIVLRETPALSGKYETAVKFNGEAERVPVLFWSEGLKDAPAGNISARSRWNGMKTVGKLFEARAFDAPDGNTVGFLTPGFQFGVTGYSGDYVRTEFDGRVAYVPRRVLKEAKAAFRENQKLPDISKGFAPRPKPGCKRSDVLVVIDAGHGGGDPGAVGPRRKREKDANLSQAILIEKKLKDAGYRTLMTRSGDEFVGLYDRVRLAYNRKASAFISIHHNATGIAGNPDTARNIKTFVSNDLGAPLAECIQRQIAKEAGIADGGVGRKSLAVCRNPAIPSCLIEFDFITSPAGEQASFDAGRQRRFAEAVLKGLDDWVFRR